MPMSEYSGSSVRTYISLSLSSVRVDKNDGHGNYDLHQ